MRKSLFFATVAALLAAISCSEKVIATETACNNPVLEEKTLFADIENTKTEFDGKKTTWLKGDAIAVLDSSSFYKFIAQESGATTTFTGSASSGKTRFGAVYPYDIVGNPQVLSNPAAFMSILLPTVQEVADGSQLPLIAYFTGTGKLAFKPLCIVIKFTIGAENSGRYKSIRISTEDQIMLSGTTKVNLSTGNVVHVANNTANYTIFQPESGSIQAGTYYVGIYPSGLPDVATDLDNLIFTFTTVSGAVSTRTVKTIIHAYRGVIYNLGEFDSDTPSPAPLDPPTDYSCRSAHWENNATLTSQGKASWTSDNRFYANVGEGAGKAFIRTKGSGITRAVASNVIYAGTLYTNSAIEFVWPGITAAAGASIDFMGTFYTSSSATPKYWIFEYYEDGSWKSVAEDLRTASENASIKYSMYLYKNNEQYETFAQTFTLEKDLVKADLRMRLRAVGKYNTGGGTLVATKGAHFVFPNMIYRAASIDIYEGRPLKDTKKILELGNSFSYYYSSCFMLKAIAASQGHVIRLRPFNKGSQFFYDFLELEKSLYRITDGSYDYAVLQDQSQQHARYAADPTTTVLKYSKLLFDKVKTYSPSAEIILENTWAYSAYDYSHYGNYEDFYDDLQKGCDSICAQTGATKSPIGVAFKQARDEGITDLNHTDNTHPNRNGAYLKACVNYLTIYKEKFDSNVPDLGVDPIIAAKLRKIAEQVVLTEK